MSIYQALQGFFACSNQISSLWYNYMKYKDMIQMDIFLESSPNCLWFRNIRNKILEVNFFNP